MEKPLKKNSKSSEPTIKAKRGRPPKDKAISKKPSGRTKTGQFKKGNKEGKKFEKGNKVAEKWTEETTLELLGKMWATLIDGHEEVNGNYVRANDIKLIQEVCLMQDIDRDTWTYLSNKFVDNPVVISFIKRITWLLEARLTYSGTSMDMFVMKNHYGYRDSKDLTNNGKDFQDKPPILNFVSADSLTDEQIEKLTNPDAVDNDQDS